MEEQGSSGITGWVNYLTGEVHLDGLTVTNTYDFDYLYKDTDFTVIYTIVPVDGNVMPSFTAYLGKDIYEHVMLGCVINQMDLSVEQELVNISLDIQAQKDKKGTIRTIDELLMNLCRGEPLKAWSHCTLKQADYGDTLADISADVRSLSLSIVNNATTEENIGLGSRFPYDGTAGALEITGSATLQFDDTSWKEAFWGGTTEPSADGSDLKTLELTITDNDGWGDAVITLGRVHLQSVTHQPSGREKMMQEISFEALWDCTTEEIINVVVRTLNNWLLWP